jgi:hypothetical protein
VSTVVVAGVFEIGTLAGGAAAVVGVAVGAVLDVAEVEVVVVDEADELAVVGTSWCGCMSFIVFGTMKTSSRTKTMPPPMAIFFCFAALAASGSTCFRGISSALPPPTRPRAAAAS